MKQQDSAGRLGKTFQDYYEYLVKNREKISYDELLLVAQIFESFANKIDGKEPGVQKLYFAMRDHVRIICAHRRGTEEPKGKGAAAPEKNAPPEENGDGEDGIFELPLYFDVDVPAEEDEENADPLTPADALVRSLDRRGAVEIPYIARLCGMSAPEVIAALDTVIYQNPQTWEREPLLGWETSDEYLAGNIAEKLAVAREADTTFPGRFAHNVEALSALMSPELGAREIYVTPGSPWVPADVIDAFILHLAGIRRNTKEAERYNTPQYFTVHDEYTGIWEIPEKNRFAKSLRYRLAETETYGTTRIGMLHLLENILNQKTVQIFDTGLITKHRSLNEPETVKAVERLEKIRSEFSRWVWRDKERAARLKAEYNRKFGNLRRRVFDGSFLSFPGMNPAMQLFDYQKNAVARILFTKNTLLAHDVGAGKTYVMIAAGMELRRQGRSKKNLYVVPNNILGQWESIFRHMYPEAKLLVVDNRNFAPARREATLERIRDEDFDGILMAYSSFDMLPLTRDYYISMYREILRFLEESKLKFHLKGKIDIKEKKIRTELEKLLFAAAPAGTSVRFDELGINTLFLDEAHYYKNVPIESEIYGVHGINKAGSAKCRGMMDKVLCVQRQNNGGRVVFATGTPVTNSLTDIFVLQKYLQGGELAFAGLHNFDSWVGMFAEKVTEYEIDIDTNSYRLKTRFARFKNVPELTALFSSVADFHRMDKNEEIPQFDGYTDTAGEGSRTFRRYLETISKRADDVRAGRVDRKTDNLLQITSDGRRAALDMRLVDEGAFPDREAKVLLCADNVARIYRETRAENATQLVFCDMSVPKAGFNLYDELKRALGVRGVPAERIAYIHDATTDKEREALFAALRAGVKSVIIGSTLKAGHGVNIQERLVALHHLDVPWRPADMIQREGRILRQGNTSERVQIFRYITKGSFDAYSWQLLEAKQRFISQILSGSCDVRESTDIDRTVLSYAEVKALAVGNPKIKQRVELANEIGRYRMLQRDLRITREAQQAELAELPQKIEKQRALIADCRVDVASLPPMEEQPPLAPVTPEQRELRRRIYEAVRDYVDHPDGVEIDTYRGFTLTVPPYMRPRIMRVRSPEGLVVDSDRAEGYICLVGKGRYFVPIGEELGALRRVDNFIAGLPAHLQKLTEGLDSLLGRQKTLERALSKERDYSATIKRLQDKLDKLDVELGIKEAS